MIDYEHARRLVLQYLADMEADSRKVAEFREDLTPREREVLGLGRKDDVLELAIIENETIEGNFGWVFFYETKKYLESGDFRDGLLGNAPIIVSKLDGRLHETGTAEPIEFYIENFKRSGNPYG
ncbi:MAG: YrhB family protein [Alphaproteobacteria bacterium]|nr:YrhB family protein [Alphaproteobacteria bacterium]